MKTFRINNVMICAPKGWHRVKRGTVKQGDQMLLAISKTGPVWIPADPLVVGESIDAFWCLIRKDSK